MTDPCLSDTHAFVFRTEIGGCVQILVYVMDLSTSFNKLKGEKDMEHKT
jgi:hypothetical protein